MKSRRLGRRDGKRRRRSSRVTSLDPAWRPHENRIPRCLATHEQDTSLPVAPSRWVLSDAFSPTTGGPRERLSGSPQADKRRLITRPAERDVIGIKPLPFFVDLSRLGRIPPREQRVLEIASEPGGRRATCSRFLRSASIASFKLTTSERITPGLRAASDLSSLRRASSSRLSPHSSGCLPRARSQTSVQSRKLKVGQREEGVLIYSLLELCLASCLRPSSSARRPAM